MDFFFDRRSLAAPDNNAVTHVQIRRVLPRLLAFAGWSIDDIVSNPIAKRDMQRWYKTELRMRCMMEIGELERQWNSIR